MNPTRLLVTGAALLAMSAVAHAQSTTAPQAGQAPAAAAPAAPAAQAPAPVAPAAQAPAASQLPPVVVPQQQPKPAQPAAVAKPKPKPAPEPDIEPVSAPKPKAKPKPKVAAKPKPKPKPVAPPPVEESDVVEGPVGPYYGAPGGEGAAARAEQAPINPINPANGIVPQNLEGFSSAASRITRGNLDSQRPHSTSEALAQVPGVHVVADDGFARHAGIGIRGGPPRRSRKTLVLEDGLPINMSIWMDPSVHYTPPMDRVEAIEVLRGPVFAFGPLTNHGVVNFQNLSPFGPNETEISFAIGSVEHKGGSEGKANSRNDFNNQRHFHTRQTSGNFGAVFSYSGAEVEGAWDLERLRYNDFHGAVGWKGIDQDLTVSVTYFRQRDNYDEANLTGEDGDPEGAVEDRFYNGVGQAKSLFNPGARFNTYNADVVRSQLTYNRYLDKDTTVTARLYGQHHRRDRYQNFDGADPSEEDDGLAAIINPAEDDEVLVPEGSMLGRLRTYRHLGAELRTEFANRPFIAGMKQDIQVGLRYEAHTFSNRNFFGAQGEILEDGDKTGLTVFDRDSTSNSFSAFAQTAIHVTSDLKVVPGVRLEHYRVKRKTFALTEEEGEAEEEVDCPHSPDPLDPEECAVIEGFSDDRFSEKFSKTKLLPGVAVAYDGLYRTTIYGGYHRGLTTGVLREAAFPPDDEIGDNFQIGVRSTALRGLTFDVAAYHHRIENFQIKGAASDQTGNNIYSNVDLVHINGVELMGRVDSNPFTGGPWNAYFEGTYTLADAKIKEGLNADGDNLAGNEVPEVPTHVARLTLGLQHKAGWDASVSWTYRSAFFTDEENTPFGEDEEGEDGEVPEVWLLSARANYKIPNTGATLFVSGDNLTNKLYLSDREDGMKPGQGRTIWGGLKIKF